MSSTSFPDSLTGPGKNTARLWGLSVCRSDGCLWWPVWTSSTGKSKSGTSSLSLVHPFILLWARTRPGAAAASSRLSARHFIITLSVPFVCQCLWECDVVHLKRERERACGGSQHSHTPSFGCKHGKYAWHERHAENPSWSVHRRQPMKQGDTEPKT